MPHPSETTRHVANADPIVVAHVILLEFQEDGRSTIHRAALNNEDVDYASNTYTATRIEIHLPGSGDTFPRVRLEMSNIQRTIGAAIARAKNRIGCRMLLVDASNSPVSLVADIDTKDLFVLSNVVLNLSQAKILADLAARASVQEPWPPERTQKLLFPGVWWDR